MSRKKVMPSKAAPVELEPQGAASGAMPRLSKFQAYTVRRVARRDLKGAPYNPRTIDKHARAKLTEIIRRGLVEAIVWNERTGNIVGGHQRTDILDSLERTQDYSLDVCVINVDEKREKAINVGLNNPAAQGVYDAGKLLEMGEIDWQAAGFDSMDLQLLFGDQAPVEHNIFATDGAPEAVKRDIDDLGALAERKREQRKTGTGDGSGGAEGDEVDEPTGETPEQRIERMRREKKEYREKAADRDDTEFYVVAVFQNRAEREAFMVSLGYGPDERYVDGAKLVELVPVEE